MKNRIIKSTFALFFTFISFISKAQDDIDIYMDALVANTPHTFTAIMGNPLNFSIGVVGAGSNVSWSFTSVLNGVGFDCNTNGTEISKCNGITVALPPNSTDPNTVPNDRRVSIAGVPASAGEINFTLSVSKPRQTEERQFKIIFRKPNDFAFTLDKSGSMSMIENGISRWDALKTAVNLFMLKLSDPAFAKNGDRVGLNFFDTNVSQPAFGAGMISLTATTVNQTVNNAFNGINPGGATAMGKGIQDAQTSKLNNISNARTMLVFTDGVQNVAPEVDILGKNIGGIPINSSSGTGSIKIFTIGVGNPSGIYLTILENLAIENRGHYILTPNGSSFTSPTLGVSNGSINDVFNTIFINALKAFSPQIVNEKEQALNSVYAKLLDFPLNIAVEDLVLEIRLNQKFEKQQLESIIKYIKVLRNGVDVTQLFKANFTGDFTDAFLLTINFNTETVFQKLPTSEGFWEVVFQYNEQNTTEMALPKAFGDKQIIADKKAKEIKAYTTAIADDHLLDYEFQSSSQPNAGRDIKFSAKLGFNNKDFDNADVFAFVYRPGEDIGDILGKNPLVVKNQDDQKDKTSIGVLKYLALLDDKDFVASLLPNESVIQLKSLGKGTYEGIYNDTKVAGIYQVLYLIRGKSPLGGHIMRYEKESIYVRFADVDLPNSNVKIISQNRSGMNLFIKPITSQGFLVGPAMTGVFKFDSEDKLAQLSEVIDNQDGSYNLIFKGSPKSIGTLTLLDKKIFTGKICKIKKVKPKKKCLFLSFLHKTPFLP